MQVTFSVYFILYLLEFHKIALYTTLEYLGSDAFVAIELIETIENSSNGINI